MPTSPEANLDKIQSESLKIIKSKIGAADTREARQPIAFGLIAVDITFIWEENLGSPEDVLKPLIEAVTDVNSFEITDVRRALG
jgi:translation elongation factor EF-1beta